MTLFKVRGHLRVDFGHPACALVTSKAEGIHDSDDISNPFVVYS